VLIGEAPGEQEDITGIPFVGRAGKFLDSVLAELGVDRSCVFITNVVRCRPPGNRKPTDEEISQCLPNLVAELKSVRPSIVVALGAVALKALTGRSGRLSDDIGKEFEIKLNGVRFIVIASYHPSAAMRNRRMRERFRLVLSKALSRIDRE
jgi:DNA polymerase